MPYQPSRTQDAILGLALLVSLACGIASFWCSFRIAFPFLLWSGLVKIHILWAAPLKLEGMAALYGCFGLSIVFGVLIAIAVFRAIIRFGNSRMPGV